MQKKKYKFPYTPTPWEVESGMVQTAYDHKCKVAGCGVRTPIALMDRKPGNGTTPCERDSNARVIGEAARMFEALQGLLEWAQYMGGWDAPAWKEAESVVSKVEWYLDN